MKATAKKTELTIVESSPADRAELALKSRETEKDLRELVARSVSITAPTNADGRQECHAAYMALRNARVAIETTGKKAREDATAFSKAVIAEEKKLVAIVDGEETRLKALRDEWDAAREAERQAMIEAERARVAALRAILSDLACLPATLAGSSSQAIREALAGLSIAYYLEQCAELADEVATTYSAAVHSLEQMISEAEDREAAEAARLAAEAEAKAAAEAEAARVAAESERLAREREAFEAEQARVAEVARIEAEKLAEERRKIDAERAEFEAMLKATEAEKSSQCEPPADCSENFAAAENFGGVDDALEEMVDDLLVDLAAAEHESPAPYTGTAVRDGMTLQDAANAVCGHVPHGYLVLLCMENGSAFVIVNDPHDFDVALPDSSDKSLAEQINDAVRAAWAHFISLVPADNQTGSAKP